MAKEWWQKCKDCGKRFGYSDLSLQKDIRKGYSRTERCDDCRKSHSNQIRSIASSHFALKPNKNKPSLLGNPFLGQLDHGIRELKEVEKHADSIGMDVGLKDHHIKQVYEALENNQVLVIVAPTGTGKSTFLPSKFIKPLEGYDIDHFTRSGPIIVTQPRIPAAREIPKTIGNKLVGSSVGAGFDIGYRHGDKTGKRRGDNYDRKRNRLIFVTDGSLINWLEEGQIGEFSMIIVDEAHERSCNIDLILGLVKRELLKYPHLKFIIASATIDAESFVQYFSPVTNVKQLDFTDCQKSFGYEEFPWTWESKEKASLPVAESDAVRNELKRYEWGVANLMANKIVELINNTETGGILGFLHGEDHIKRTIKLISDRVKKTDVRIFPLYTGVGPENIEAALAEIKERRIVIATNIAETSLTIPDVVYVVDSGLIKQSDWNPITCRQELGTKFHSKDGCKQRWGRAGRVQKGYVHKLYSKEKFLMYFPDHTSPEIKRSNAESLILGALASGVNDLESFSLLERPDKIELDRAMNVIKKRGIIDPDSDFTEEGREIYRLSKALSSVLDKVEFNSTQRSLDVATFLVLADRHACLVEAVTAICMMPRMGNALYWGKKKVRNGEIIWEGDGLIKWDQDLNLLAKDYRIRQLNSLKIGCIDDLDFSCKLFSLSKGSFFEQKLPKGYKEEFATRYSLNQDNFNLINETRGRLLEIFSQGKKSREIRDLNYSLINRVRALASLAWPDRVVSIQPGNSLWFESNDYNYKGIISENCAGDWQREKKAVIGILDQNEIDFFINGNRERVPVANFMIKHVNVNQSKKFPDIINSFRSLAKEKYFTNAVINNNITFEIPINAKVEPEKLNKNSIAKKLFLVQQDNLNSNNADDLFLNTIHFDSPIENKIEFSTYSYNKPKISEQLIIENWSNSNDGLIAEIAIYKKYDPASFSELRTGSKVEGIIRRPIYNIKGNGLREISGYIVDIAGFNYSLPAENVAIEKFDETLQGLVGQTLTLIKTGTTELKHPIFSLIPLIEEERLKLVASNEVSGEVTRVTDSRVYFKARIKDGKFDHPVSVSIRDLKENIKYLEPGGKVTLIIRLRNHEQGKIEIPCTDDEELSYEEIDRIEEILRWLLKNPLEYEQFTKRNIYISTKDPIIYSTQPIGFKLLSGLINKFPELHNALRSLHARTWEVDGHVKGIEKAYVELLAEVQKMKILAKSADYSDTQTQLKQFKWHTVKLSDEHNVKIKVIIDQIWEISNLKNEIDYRKYVLIPRFKSELNGIPEYKTNWRASVMAKIRRVELEINEREQQVKEK